MTDLPHLLLTIAGTACAVPAAHVLSVAPWLGATPVPGAPAGLAGIANVRGQLLPVVRLDPTGDAAILAILAKDGQRCALLAEATGGLGAAGGARVLDVDALLAWQGNDDA